MNTSGRWKGCEYPEDPGEAAGTELLQAELQGGLKFLLWHPKTSPGTAAPPISDHPCKRKTLHVQGPAGRKEKVDEKLPDKIRWGKSPERFKQKLPCRDIRLSLRTDGI